MCSRCSCGEGSDLVHLDQAGCHCQHGGEGELAVILGHLLTEAGTLLAACRAAGKKVATAESCTGGLVAAVLTDVAGSSDVLERGFVTYSNAAKHDMVGVPMELIVLHGAVSEEVARAMAAGALAHSRADIAVSVTGFAGPEGGTREKLVGLVCFGLARRGAATSTERQVFAGDRSAIRLAAVARALELLRGAV